MQLDRPPRWRRLLKDALASTIWRAHACPLPASLAPKRQRPPLVVGYHRVVDDFAGAATTDMPTMLTSRAMFERHVDWIGRQFDFVSLDDIGDHIARGVPFARPVAAITFDDGYRDVYENALPVLSRKGVPAAVFVITELVGRSCWQLHDKLYHLMAKAYMKWDDQWTGLTRLLADADISPASIPGLRAASRNPYSTVSTLLPECPQAHVGRLMELLIAQVGNGAAAIPQTVTWPMLDDMRRAGFTIGSHTKTHTWLANECQEKSVDEIAGSKQELERRFGEPIVHFAYPGGQFTPPIVEMVADAGYRFAYTACDHHDSRYPALTIERLLLWEGSSIDAGGRFSPAILNCQTHGLWPPSHKCERVHSA